MSRLTPTAVSSSSAGDQSSVTPTSQMNGMITSESHDSAERSPSPAAAAAVERTGHAGDVIKSSFQRARVEASAVSCAGVSDTAQQNEISSTAAVDSR